jgi:hypothetical protein
MAVGFALGPRLNPPRHNSLRACGAALRQMPQISQRCAPMLGALRVQTHPKRHPRNRALAAAPARRCYLNV